MIPRATEAVIIGAGPAGSVFASTLAQGGRDVVVLESGPAWTLEDLISSQIWARRLKWGGPATLKGGQDPLGTGFTGGWGFGGAALHHYAGWPRLTPDDLRLQSLYGQGVDWPLTYDDLRPFYDRIQDEVGLAGDVSTETGRPDRAPYPMPPMPVFPQAQRLAQGFTKLGRQVRPMSVAINTVPYRGRPACLWDGWCDAGCPTGALSNPLVTYLPRAKAAGAKFFAHTTAARITMGAKHRATGVAYFDAQGEERQLQADVVILAGGAIQNPRLLLNSATSQYPHGLGNSSGLLGRYFIYHVLANLYGMFDGDMQNHIGTSVPAIWGASATPRNRPDGPFGHYGWGIGPALKPNDLLGIAMSRTDLFGNSLHDFLRRAIHSLGSINAIAETLPVAENRVELGDQRDRFNVPLPRLVNSYSTNTRALWDLARQDGYRLMEAAGANGIWHSPMIATHQLGGTRMGHDPGNSVTDSFGRLHDVGNIFVAGGGLFPTCGTTGPTFTIHALALRAAEHIVGSPVTALDR